MFDFSVHDADSGVTYRPWTDGHAVGYQVGWPDGSLTYIYLNASGGSDDGAANVFVYEGNAGDPRQDPPVHHYDLDWPEQIGRASLPGIVLEFGMSRSCFIDFPTAEAAEHAIAVLHEMSVIVDPLVEHRVNNTMQHFGGQLEPEYWSVHFTLNCDSGSPEEAAFIEAATKLGGIYSGTLPDA